MHLIKPIISTVHSLLETAHSENFQNQETLDVMLRFRKQLRLSYYTNLSESDNIPIEDRRNYIIAYERITTSPETGREVQSEQHYIEQKHKLKMLTFMAQDSYEVIN